MNRIGLRSLSSIGAQQLLQTLLIVTVLLTGCTNESSTIRILSTTSTQNSGLLAYLAPQILDDTGIAIQVVAMGTGQAIHAAQRGDADVLMVHHQPSEERFIEQGYGDRRIEIMYNDFILVGPRDDPAQVNQAIDLVQALANLHTAIAAQKVIFISRGDDSGTHKAEQRFWRHAKRNPRDLPSRFYREIGAGMGATLNMASTENAYCFVDRGTWLSFKNKGKLAVLFTGDQSMINRYSIVTLRQDKYPHLNHAGVKKFVAWITSKTGQEAIGAFRVNGEVLFKPSAPL